MKQKTKTDAFDSKPDEDAKIKESVRAQCLAAAQAAYEDAGVRGLCEEGRWECALDAIRALTLKDLSG